MKIAFLSDIHGNYYALESVLNECRKIGVEKYFFLGDYVGYYYQSDKVLESIYNLEGDFIKGNHELILEELDEGLIDEEEIKKKYGSGHKIAMEKLLPKYKNFLYKLPESLVLSIDSFRFQISHANPWNNKDYIYPDTVIDNDLKPEIDYAFFGHSHYQFLKILKSKKLIMNVGSVGQNREKSGVANWLVFDTALKHFRCMSTHYDVDKLLSDVIKVDGVNSYNYKVLVR